MTTTEPFQNWAYAEMADGNTDVPALLPYRQAEDLQCPSFIHSHKCHPQFVRARGWANHRKPTSNFNLHWEQTQFALALLLWLIAAAIVAWMVS